MLKIENLKASVNDKTILDTTNRLNNIYTQILLHILSVDKVSINNKDTVVPFATRSSSKIVEKLLNYDVWLHRQAGQQVGVCALDLGVGLLGDEGRRRVLGGRLGLAADRDERARDQDGAEDAGRGDDVRRGG